MSQTTGSRSAVQEPPTNDLYEYDGPHEQWTASKVGLGAGVWPATRKTGYSFSLQFESELVVVASERRHTDAPCFES